MQDLIEIETWPTYDFAGQDLLNIKPPMMNKDYFACRGCLRLRPAQHFSNVQMKGRCGEHSSLDNSKERTKRTCIDFAMAAESLHRGTMFRYGGAKVGMNDGDLGGGLGVVCRKCGFFGRVMSQHQLRLKECEACEQSTAYGRRSIQVIDWSNQGL